MRFFFAYNGWVPEKLCEVTVVDCYGVRPTIQVNAKSTYWAACHYFGRSRANPTENLPQSNDSTICEVKVVGEEKIPWSNHRKMMARANKVAQQQTAGRR